MKVEQVNLSKDSELTSHSLKCRGQFWKSAQPAGSHRFHPASPLTSVRLQQSRTHQSTAHRLPDARLHSITGIHICLHWLLKETSSKAILSELRCAQDLAWRKRKRCLSFMGLTVNSLSFKLLIYITAGKSHTTSPETVSNETQSYTQSIWKTGEKV